MEEKDMVQVSDSQPQEKLYTKDEVVQLMKRRVERTHNAFFSRYGVKDLAGLDDVVEAGYKYKKLLEEENTAEAKEEISIDELIGMDKIKNRIHRLALLALKNRDCGVKQSMNYVFLGNPGTGKTITARAIAKEFFDLGIISKNLVIDDLLF